MRQKLNYLKIKFTQHQLTLTFIGFTALANDILICEDDFPSLIMGLVHQQTLTDPLNDLFGYAFGILVREAALTLQIRLY